MKMRVHSIKLPALLPILFFVCWIIVTLLVKNSYVIHIIFMVSIYACLSASLNIAVGITGLSNMSHATFFGIGAYVAALLALKFNASFLITLVASGLVAMVFGLIIGAPTLRLKGFFLSLATISFGQLIRAIEISWTSLTNGPMGLKGVPGASIGSYSFSVKAYVFYALALIIICYYVSQRMLACKTGRAMMAIKSDDLVAKSLGINTTYYKVLAFAISALFAGMVGSIYAHRTMFVSPDSFTQTDSTTILCMVILGSSGSLLGPLVGAIILQVAPEVLRFADNLRLVFVGVVMILGVLSKELHWGERIKIFLSEKILRHTPRKEGD